ncbi:unnamed protein product [Peniophora sp. CBMAI 1063]|nr:unnamed protein product [Peniophora sp. CBMAI 1063]
MWDQGYSIADIKATLVEYCLVSLQTEESAMISFVVSALTKKPKLSFDPTTLCTLVEDSLAAYQEHAAFLPRRRPIAPTMPPKDNPLHPSPLAQPQHHKAQ